MDQEDHTSDPVSRSGGSHSRAATKTTFHEALGNIRARVDARAAAITRAVPGQTREVTGPNECPWTARWAECRACEAAERTAVDFSAEPPVRHTYRVGRCYARQRYAALLSVGGITGQALRQTFDRAVIDQHNRRLYTAARDWTGQGGRTMYIHGDTGTGKSYCLRAIAHSLAQRGTAFLYRDCPALLADLREIYDSDVRESAVMARYCHVPVLLLNELGKEALRRNRDGTLAEWAPEKLWTIIDYRIEHGLAMGMTSNFDLDALAERLGPNHGPAIASRIVHACASDVYELRGPNRWLAADAEPERSVAP